ncbi:MAG: putative DNA binding domain-containing protein [Lentisphaeria bacterium]|nr:putative DNA binding domain-containing protein [Lentisphaeria bacterium]MDY0177237.1 putative DNA binding domain-containing protein [Lentisphaeria bacterium]NLZ59644.1 AAA family ATPase [Lentisphaerota bacterium]
MLSLPESSRLEYKRDYSDNIRRCVIAFANSDGGKIYVGIEDDGRVCGLPALDESLLRISNSIRNSIVPDLSMFTRCEVLQIEDKQVICIEVERGTARPYYWREKGLRPEGVFVRHGAATVPASQAAILQMIRDSASDSFEERRSLLQELSFEQSAPFFQNQGLAFGSEQRRTMHFFNADGLYNNLALLLSDQCRHSMRLAVFQGGEKILFRDRRELNGSLLKQLEESHAFLQQHNRLSAEFVGLQRIDRYDYPPEAIREALLNLIVHRDYSLAGSSLVSLFDNRLELVGLGGLVGGLSLEDVNLGVSLFRNRNLGEIFYRLRLIEAYGTGLLKIKEAYHGFALQPKIELSANAFKLTLYNRNHSMPPLDGRQETVQAADREHVVMRLIKRSGLTSRREVELACDISQGAANLLLREMCQKGLILRRGAGKKTHYTLNTQAE